MDLEAYASAVASLEADVVALQEVDDKMIRSRRADMTALAAAAAGGHGAFGSARRRFDFGRYGNAIVSKHRLSDVEVIPLPRSGWRRERRSAVAATVQAEMPWRIASTHLSLYKDESQAQLEFLLKRFGSGRPTVLMGDFNRHLDEISDLVEEYGWTLAKSGPTFPSWGPDQIIDFIVVKEATIGEASVLSLPVSDHCALVSEVTIKV